MTTAIQELRRRLDAIVQSDHHPYDVQLAIEALGFVEQLSAQTAELTGGAQNSTNPAETRANAEVEVEPNIAEQPSLSDALDIYEAQTKALPFGHEIRDRGYSAYNWQMAAIRDIRALLAQRQDSNKDALEVVHKFLLGEGSLDDFYFGDSDTRRPRSPFWWRKYLRAAIANGAPK